MLDFSLTLKPEVGPVSVSVHVPEAPGTTPVFGVQLNVESVLSGAVNERVTLFDEALSDAVTVALWFDVTVPAVAVNDPDEAPADTVTDDGTVTIEVDDTTAMSVDVCAAFERLTEHVVLELAVNVVAKQLSDETLGGDTSEIVAILEEPFNEAVTVAV